MNREWVREWQGLMEAEGRMDKGMEGGWMVDKGWMKSGSKEKNIR